jgi:tetraacyldisaccharide 4'-kinase
MLQRVLTQAWLSRGLLAYLLWPVSVLYGTLVHLRRMAYQHNWLASSRLPVPVLVVGNVVVGGAGKTPVVMALVQHLQAQGLAVGILSRGYGRVSQTCLQVTPDSPVADVGDEPLLMARRTGAPVVVGRDRVQAGHTLLALCPKTQVIVCDDGLQHLALQRDLEIGVFDDRGVGNGFFLPAGPLREAWPRSIDLLLHTGQQPAFAGFTASRALADYALRKDGLHVPLSDLIHASAEKPLAALAGIAQPEAFFAMLRKRGVVLATTFSLPDHYDFESFSRNDYKHYRLICTEKDAVKLWAVAPDALAIPLNFAPEAEFWQAFDARLHSLLQH